MRDTQENRSMEIFPALWLRMERIFHMRRELDDGFIIFCISATNSL